MAESNEERESGRGTAYGGSVMAERRERGREAVEERERKREKRIRWAQQR